MLGKHLLDEALDLWDAAGDGVLERDLLPQTRHEDQPDFLVCVSTRAGKQSGLHSSSQGRDERMADA